MKSSEALSNINCSKQPLKKHHKIQQHLQDYENTKLIYLFNANILPQSSRLVQTYLLPGRQSGTRCAQTFYSDSTINHIFYTNKLRRGLNVAARKLLRCRFLPVEYLIFVNIRGVKGYLCRFMADQNSLLYIAHVYMCIYTVFYIL